MDKSVLFIYVVMRPHILIRGLNNNFSQMVLD
jgi:hypothetical protein